MKHVRICTYLVLPTYIGEMDYNNNNIIVLLKSYRYLIKWKQSFAYAAYSLEQFMLCTYTYMYVCMYVHIEMLFSILFVFCTHV